MVVALQKLAKFLLVDESSGAWPRDLRQVEARAHLDYLLKKSLFITLAITVGLKHTIVTTSDSSHALTTVSICFLTLASSRALYISL